MELPKRKPTRLKNYDYSSPGAYFVTICTQGKRHLFEMEPNDIGNDLCVVPPESKSANINVGNDQCTVPPKSKAVNADVGNDLRVVPPENKAANINIGNDQCTVPPEKKVANINVGNDLCVVPPPQNQIIHKWLKEVENKFDNIKIDKYVIMPNHIHLILIITERNMDCSLPVVMKWFKAMVTNEYIKGVRAGILKQYDKKLWQKSYHDHIIRDERDYRKIWNYIDTNALRWNLDCFYSEET